MAEHYDKLPTYTKPKGKLKPLVYEIKPDVLGLLKPVSVELVMRLIGIANWDLSFLANRVMVEHGKSKTEAERGILEVKRYHAIDVLDPTYVHAISHPVDPYWHEHLHFSVDYKAFCEKFVGQFKDHFPIDESILGVREQLQGPWKRTLKIYEEYFGKPDPKWWTDGPVCLDVNHMIGHYMNGWYEPLDWKKILAGKLDPYEPTLRNRNPLGDKH